MQIYIAPYRTTNPQRRFTIRIHADVITIIINCFHTRWYKNVPLVDDENVVNDVAPQTVLGSEFHNIRPPTAKALSANCRQCGAGISCLCAFASRNVEGSPLILPPNQKLYTKTYRDTTDTSSN